MDWEQRIWGYSGAMGLVQAFAAGYFVWDLTVSLIYIRRVWLGAAGSCRERSACLQPRLCAFPPFPSTLAGQGLIVLRNRNPSSTTTDPPHPVRALDAVP